MEVWSVRSKVTSPTKARVGSRTRPNPKKAAPKLLAVATRPRATRPPETAARNMFARPFDSAIVAERAPWSTKCSVVTNVTAAERGSAPPVASWSLVEGMAIEAFIGDGRHRPTDGPSASPTLNGTALALRGGYRKSRKATLGGPEGSLSLAGDRSSER